MGAIAVVFWGGVMGTVDTTRAASLNRTGKDASGMAIVSGSAGVVTGMGRTGRPFKI